METTYYGIEIWQDDATDLFVYALCGWIYEVKTLEEAKADIKKNWRQDATYWKNF